MTAYELSVQPNRLNLFFLCESNNFRFGVAKTAEKLTSEGEICYVKPMKRARKKRQKSVIVRWGKSVLKNPLLKKFVLVCFCYIVIVNAIVAWMGASGSFLLSPMHIWNKTQAIGYYASHKMTQWGAPSPPSTKQALRRAVQHHRVPRNLVFAIAKAESGFMADRISRTGAMGLMQMMPATAKNMGVEDPFHPVDNAEGGTKYLAWLWRRYRGDKARVAAAYNAGPGRIPRTGPYRAPPETRAYVHRVLKYSRQL